jgi:hypothetical protein
MSGVKFTGLRWCVGVGGWVSMNAHPAAWHRALLPRAPVSSPHLPCVRDVLCGV